MIKIAGRSVVLSFLALIVTFFYIQPEVGEAFNLANDSQNTLSNDKTIETTKETTTVKTEATEAVETADKKVENTADNPGENKNSKNTNLQAFKATAYCLKGRTASGGGVRRGIVAADPRVLPLGTRIYMSAGPYSGTYVVADTGGAVKGRILDVWVPNQAEAMRFGRRKVTVSVLGR
jgi:3D (Asp-Asp-Asp) domain-containing protein